MTRRFSLTLLLLAAMAAPLASQEVDGILLDGRRQTPVPRAMVTLLDSVGELAARGTTRADGRFRFRVDASGPSATSAVSPACAVDTGRTGARTRITRTGTRRIRCG